MKAKHPKAHRRQPLISVVVLNYNGEKVLDACLASLRQQDYQPCEVVVVDNQSTDQSLRQAQAKYPEFRYLRLKKNLGFCAGNHAGVKASRGAYVALVNNDTRLPRGFIRVLAETLDQHPRAWIAAPRIHNRNLDMTAYPAAGTMSLTGLIIQNVFKDPGMIFGAPGAAFMFRKAEVGLPFDEDYLYFHEDVYVSWRAWLTGHEVIACPEVQVEHVGSASFQGQSPWYLWLIERNRLLNFFSFWQGKTLFRIAPLLILMLACEQVADLFAGRPIWPRWRAYFWILTHGFQILRKRRILQAQRRVLDSALISRMSCRVTNLSHPLARGLNWLARIWCRGMRLKTFELLRKAG